jgi:hypothetical protein
MENITIGAGEHIDPIAVRLVDDEPNLPPFLEIQHENQWECVMIDRDRLPDLIRALEGFLEDQAAE